MEENNRKGPGVFYAVVGVATLVVAIIGATFAYFSASETATTPVEGNTLDIAGNFKVEVTQLTPAVGEGAGLAASANLVPTSFGNNVTITSANAIDAVESALGAKCVSEGYTGCHVWKVTATTGQDLSTASLTLDIKAPKGNNWSYVVFKNATDLTAMDGTVGTVTLSAAEKAVGKFTTTGTKVDMHNGASMKGVSTGVSETYYVMVYLQNVEDSQNKGDGDETGKYSGTVTFAAAGGEVKASFTLA